MRRDRHLQLAVLRQEPLPVTQVRGPVNELAQPRPAVGQQQPAAVRVGRDHPGDPAGLEAPPAGR